MRNRVRRPLIDREVLDNSIVVEALYNALTKNPAFFERKVRRWFSKNFNTALMDTYQIPWDQILTHYYESIIEDKSYNQIFEMTVDGWLPDIVKQKEAQDEHWIKELEEEQRRTLEMKEKKKKKKEPEPKKKDEPEKRPEMSLSFDEEQFKDDLNIGEDID